MARHKFHGALERFDVVASFISDYYGNNVRYIADVAGGQGMLSRVLAKKYGYEPEVIDPRGWALRGVQNRAEQYEATMASYYDLVVGLHPDEAIRPVVESALQCPTIVIPCCNFWDRSTRLGRDALIDALAEYYESQKINYEKIVFKFAGPKNIGIATQI